MKGDLTGETALFKKIFERLVQFNTEYKHALIFSYQSKSEQVFFGTRNAKEKLKRTFICSCPCTCQPENNQSWNQVFYDDNLDAIREEHLLDVDPHGHANFVTRVQTEETLVALFPSNLKFVVYRQCADWLRNR